MSLPISQPHRTASPALLAAALLALASISGCGRTDDLHPPQIAYGQAECDFCKMIISDEPFAAAAVLQSPDGIQSLAFDDIGCLLQFLREKPSANRIVTYVHDYESHAWLEADKCTFVQSDSLQTPMASHLAACRTREAAAALSARFPGTLNTLEQLLTRDGKDPHATQSKEGNAP